MECFLEIKSGYYNIGVNEEDINGAFRYFKDPVIKPVYLAASSPARQVYVEKFKIGKKLVSFNEFARFIDDSGYITESEKEGWGWVWEKGWLKKNNVSWKRPFGNSSDDLCKRRNFPVMQVSWNDAVEYTRWKSLKESVNYRLPYEAEWEAFAWTLGINSFLKVKAGTTSVVDDSFAFLEKLSAVGEYQTGLVWEWTLDWYEGYSGEQKNRDFGNIYKVLRGGSLLSNDIQRTRDFRFRRCPTARSPYYGFRIVQLKNQF